MNNYIKISASEGSVLKTGGPGYRDAAPKYTIRLKTGYGLCQLGVPLASGQKTTLRTDLGHKTRVSQNEGNLRPVALFN